MTTLFGPVESAELPIIEAVSRKKHGWLPILTVLFLISYALMTFLIVEQGRTIESQRTLIRELFRDSRELSAAKMKAHEGNAQTAQGQATANQASHIPSAQAPSTQTPSTQTPSTQTPSTQAQAKQAPSSQAGSQVRKRAAQQKPFRMPSRPESDLMDSGRSLITI